MSVGHQRQGFTRCSQGLRPLVQGRTVGLWGFNDSRILEFQKRFQDTSFSSACVLGF